MLIAISEWKNLEKLNLGGNKLTSLPPEVNKTNVRLTISFTLISN